MSLHLRRSPRRFFFRLPLHLSRFIAVGITAATLSACATGSSTAAGGDDQDKTPEQIAFSNYQIDADKKCLAARKLMAASLEGYELHLSTSKGVIKGKLKVARPQDVEAYVTDQIRHLEEQQKQVRAIALPESPNAVQLTKLWDEADKLIVAVKAKPTLAITTNPFKPMAKQLDVLGFKECFQPQRPDLDTSAPDTVSPDTTVA
jgi:hypothetical protein